MDVPSIGFGEAALTMDRRGMVEAGDARRVPNASYFSLVSFRQKSRWIGELIPKGAGLLLNRVNEFFDAFMAFMAFLYAVTA